MMTRSGVAVALVYVVLAVFVAAVAVDAAPVQGAKQAKSGGGGGESPDHTMSLPIIGDIPEEFKTGGPRDFDVEMAMLTDEEKTSLTTPPHWRCNACLGAAHMLTEYVKEEELKDPVTRANLTERRRLKEHEVIEVVENLCSNNNSWASFGALAQKSKINYLFGPGVPPPPKSEQIEGKHHTTTSGPIFRYRMQQKCSEILGIIAEDEMYEMILAKKPINKKVCYKKGQDCNPKKEKTKELPKAKKEEKKSDKKKKATKDDL